MDGNPTPNPAPQEPLSSNPPSSPPPPLNPAPNYPVLNAPPAAAPSGIVVDGPATVGQPVVGGAFGPQPSSTFSAQPQVATPAAGSAKRFPKAVVIAVAAFTVLGFGSAAAYFGVVVPNQPANQLKTALINTVKEKQQSFKGTLNVDETDNSFSAKIDLDGKSDTDKKAFALTTGISVSGVKMTVEARMVDSNIYLKTSDLNTIATLASQYDPEAGNLVKSVSGAISNKWIEVDSTLLKEAGASCVLDSSWSFTDKDVDLLVGQYKKSPFATIKDTSSDPVNGEAATKFNIQIDDKKLEKYTNGLDGLSIVKSLKECSTGDDLSNDVSDATASDGTTDLELWVDKATKHVKQISFKTDSKEEAAEGVKANLTVNFDYKPVSIDKPTGATPLVDVLAQLQSIPGVSDLGLASLAFPGANTKAADSARQASISALQTQLEIFYQNNGFYPSLADMNNPSWVAANMKNADTATFQDPEGNSNKFSSTPAPKVYAYQPKSATGGSCESDDTTCATYKVIATLSDGSTYAKENLD